MSVLRKFALASVVSLSAIGMSSGANAAWHHHGGHWGGGFGPGFVGGFAFGALASPYAWGVGPYYYGGGPYAYDYGPDCYLRRRVVINRWGERIVRRVRICY